MLAVRVPPSACSTSQSTTTCRSPSSAHVARGAQRAADQPLDLDGAAALLALGRLTVDALGRRARQHRVLGGHPALALALHPARHVLVDARRAQHAGPPERDEHRCRPPSRCSRARTMIGRSSSRRRPSGRGIGLRWSVTVMGSTSPLRRARGRAAGRRDRRTTRCRRSTGTGARPSSARPAAQQAEPVAARSRATNAVSSALDTSVTSGPITSPITRARYG